MPKQIELYPGKFVTAYRPEELQESEIQELIKEASRLWQQRQSEYVLKNGEQGSCVIGAGFEVYVLYPKCRIPRVKKILRPYGYQREFTWLDSHKEVEDLLRTKLDCDYCCGSMD